MWEFSGSIQLPNNSKLCRILKQWILNFVSLSNSLSNLSVTLFSFSFSSVSSFQFFFVFFKTKPYQLNRNQLLKGLVYAINLTDTNCCTVWFVPLLSFPRVIWSEIEWKDKPWKPVLTLQTARANLFPSTSMKISF